MTPPRFQFNLRTLLILATVCAALFALMARWSYNARQQRVAVEAIWATEGLVTYDFEENHSGITSPPYWPKWLVDALGVDYFANVVEVELRSLDIDLTVLRPLPKLRRVYLYGDHFSDDDRNRTQKTLPTCDVHRLRNT